MPPTSRDSAGAQPRPLALLSRSELGDEFSYACRVALGERRRSRGGGTLDWLHHPMVEAVLHEITLRYYDAQEELDMQMRLFDSMMSRK